MFLRCRRERFVRALQNPLRANVNPAPRGHLAVHHQPRAVEFVEALPIVPVAHQVRVAQQHPWRVFVRSKNSHRLARLHQQGFIRLQRLQRPHNRMKTLPIPRCLPRPSVNDKIFGLLRHFGAAFPVPP